MGCATITKLPSLDVASGDKVRSFDFPDDVGSYVDGVVTEVGIRYQGCDRYKIEVERVVAAGKDVTDAWMAYHKDHPYVYPPINGTPSLFGGEAHGVMKI